LLVKSQIQSTVCVQLFELLPMKHSKSVKGSSLGLEQSQRLIIHHQ